MDLNRKTIINVYDELNSQGWVEVSPQRGVFVSSSLPQILERSTIQRSIIDKPTNPSPIISQYNFGFDDGFPDPRLAPVESLVKRYRQIATTPVYQKLLTYGNPQGDEKLRVVLSQYLNDTRGMNCLPENILITRGSQMGLYLISESLINTSDKVIIGQSNYQAVTNLFERRKAEIFSVNVDEKGIVVDEIKKLCKKNRIDFVYLTPHHHHPTTVTLSAERRMQLLELAREFDFFVIEDDYDYDFHYESAPILPLASSDVEGNVIYIGSFSKTIAPAFRVGYTVVSEKIMRKLMALRKLIDHQGDSILERALAELIIDGEITRYLRRSLREYKKRRDTMCENLETKFQDVVKFKIPEGGMAVYARFNPSINLLQLKEHAAKKDMFLQDVREYGINENALRLGFASKTESELITGLTILRKLL